MARREVTQVVQNPLLPPIVDRTVEDLRSILSGAGQLAAQAIDATARQIQLDTQRKETTRRLDEKKFELQSATELQTLENQLGAERMKTRATNELFEVVAQDFKAMEENEKNGALALLARTEDSDLPRSARDMGIVAPENLIDIDRAIGERQAMSHYPELKKQFLEDTTKTPREHLTKWFEGVALNSSEQATGYMGLMTNLIRADEEQAIVEMVRAGKKIGVENAVFKIQRDASLNASEYANDLPKLDARLRDLHAEAVKFNQSFSTLDVAQTFSQYVLPQMLDRMSGSQQKAFIARLSAQKDTPYLTGISADTWAAANADADAKIAKEQKANAEALQARVDSMTSATDVDTASRGIVAASKGGFINDVQLSKLREDFQRATKKVKSLMKFDGMRSGHPEFANAVPSPEESEQYSDYWDKVAADHVASTGQQMPFDQLLKEQLRAGALSDRTKAQVNKLIDAPAVKGQDGSLDVSTVEQGLAVLSLIKDNAPSYYAENYVLDRDKRLPEKVQVAVSLVDAGFDRSEAARLMSQLDPMKLAEAKQVLSQSNGLDLAFALKDASGTNLSRILGVGWEISDRGHSRKAVSMTENLFKVYYAGLNIGDPETRVKEAKSRAVAFVSQRFDKAKINGVRYHYERSSMPISKDVLQDAFAPVADVVAFSLYLEKAVGRESEVQFDLDGVTYDDKEMRVPVTFSGVPTSYVVRFPLDPMEQNRYRKDKYKVATEMVRGWLKKPVESGKPVEAPPVQAGLLMGRAR